MSSSDVKNNGKQGKQPDARRNLYVLGLPFELTKYVPLLMVLVMERSVTVVLQGPSSWRCFLVLER